MKLDPNCVRDVLLFLEAQPYVKKNMDGDIEIDAVWLGQISEKLTRYPEEVIYYTLSKLHEGEYIDMTELWADDHLSICCVNFITYNANQGLKAREGGRKTAQKSRECKYVANKSHNTLLRCLRQ